MVSAVWLVLSGHTLCSAAVWYSGLAVSSGFEFVALGYLQQRLLYWQRHHTAPILMHCQLPSWI